jgi:hypothetical protein
VWAGHWSTRVRRSADLIYTGAGSTLLGFQSYGRIARPASLMLACATDLRVFCTSAIGYTVSRVKAISDVAQNCGPTER